MTRLTTGEGLRKRVGSKFVQVPRETIRDKSLSFRARGLLAYLLDLPDNWVIRADWLAEQAETGEGRDAIAATLRELRARGYYRVERRRMPDGTFRTGGAVSDVAVDEWIAEHAASSENAPKGPRWDATVRVTEDGYVEGEEDGAHDLPAVTGGDDSGTPTEHGFPVTGFPVTGEPDSGSPLLFRETEKGDQRRRELPLEVVSPEQRAREAGASTRGVAAEVRSCRLCDDDGNTAVELPAVDGAEPERVPLICLHDHQRNVRAVAERRKAREVVRSTRRRAG